MSNKNIENDENLNIEPTTEVEPKEDVKPKEDVRPKAKVSEKEDVKTLKAQLDESQEQLKATSGLLSQAMELIKNLASGVKLNPDKEIENADRGVVDWKPGQPKTPIDEYLSERVPFKAFKDNDKYKDDIRVLVNGYPYTIKRGVQVPVPRFVLMAIDNAEMQMAAAADHSQELQDQFRERSREFGINID